MSKKMHVAVFLGLGGLCCLLGLQQAASMLPHRTPGTLWFLMRYHAGLDHEGALANYAGALKAHGVAPSSFAAQHLAEQLRRSLWLPTKEVDALLDFFLAQPSGPTGAALLNIGANPSVAEALVGRSLSRIPIYPGPQQEQALAIIEQLRRGRPMYKPRLVHRKGAATAIGDALARYQAWWQPPLTWMQRRAHDPLVGAAVEWIEP